MKIKYLLPFLFIVVISCNTKPTESIVDLKYLLSFYNNRIHVKLFYTPVESDSTKFIYGEPMFGGQQDIIKGLTNIKVSGGNRVRFDERSREISVVFKSEKKVEIEYDIIDTHTAEQGLRGELFRPLISRDYLYCHGVNLFFNPVFRDPSLKARQTVAWEKLPDFRLFHSFDPENDGTNISKGEQADFLFTIITGAKDMSIEKLVVSGTKNYLVLRTNKLKEYNRRMLSEYFTKYYAGIREFWKDSSTHPYSLIVQQFLNIDHSMSGMGLGNGFSGKYSYKIDTTLSTGRMMVLSHEIGHYWIGGKIDTGTGDQWFGEGFNDYLTFYTLAMTGLLTADQFEHEFNSILTAHYSSKVKGLPNESVWKNYWKMGDYNKLPYRRGAIFAFYLDNQIRRASNGAKTIHDLMLSIQEYRNKKAKDFQLSVDDFIEITAAYVGETQIRKEIEKFIIKGDPIQFTKGMLTDEFSLSFKGDIPVIEIAIKEKFQHYFK